MKAVSTTIRRVLETISVRASRRQFQALALMAAMLMPIAAPIPAWGFDLNLPPMPVANEVPLASTINLSPSSVWTRLNDRFSDAAELIGEMTGEDPAERDARKTAERAAELKARVKDIETRLEESVELAVGESLVLSAVPVDENGATVHGVTAKWTSKDYSLIQIDGDRAVAMKAGETEISVRAGDVVETVAIKIGGDRSETEEEPKSEAESNPEVAAAVSSQPAMMMTIPDQNTRESSYSPENNVGSPAKVTEMDSPHDTTSARIRHRAGVANYNFSVPFASLPGRGIDASVGMTYNSRVWNKLGDGTNAGYQFNVDQNWIAPGFTLGYGKLTSYFTNKPVLTTSNQYKMFNFVVPEGYTDSNGTRHKLECKATAVIPNTQTNMDNTYCSEYGSTDGSFVRVLYHGTRPLSPWLQDDLSAYATTYFTLIHSDGTRVVYSVPGFQFGQTDYAREHYPVIIQDRNGNQVSIAYKDGKDKIDYVRDTLGRYIRFYYETGNENKLVAVTVPSFNGGADRQTIRFYYENVTFTPQGRFSGTAILPNPSTFQTLKYVYFPSTGSGFKYDYHPNFGMIKKISKLAGMTVDSTSTTSTGSVSSEGTIAASTEYLYPNDGSTTPLTDVPKYTQRTDDWLGRTTSGPAITYYDAPEPGTGADQISTVTVPEADFDVDYKSVAHNTSDWKNGLIKETSVIKRFGPTRQYTAQMARKVYTWIEGLPDPVGRKAPVISKIEITNDAAQTKSQTFEYDVYGNQTIAREHDFAAAGTTGTELRRTETTFVSTSPWLNNGLAHLPQEMKTMVGSTIVAKTVYEYDNYNSVPLAQTPGVIQHDAWYSAQPGTHPCNPHYECGPGEFPPHGCGPMVYDDCPNSDPAAGYRGNVTKVTVWADPSQENDPGRSMNTIAYDITGNVVTESGVSCCNIQTLEYSATNQYAYLTKVTKGSSPQLVTHAEYNFNTGLVTKTTDENGNDTVSTYDPVSVRRSRVDQPSGAWSTFEYNEELYPFSVKTTTSLDSTRSLQNWSYVNGIGQMFRKRSTTSSGYLSTDIEYDNLGRTIRTYNPYTVASLSDPRPASGVAVTAVTKFDALGQMLEVTMPDLTTVTAEYSGTVGTVTDQAGKKRREVSDALGRTVRVDEPISSPPDGDPLGPVGAPHQPTYYEFNANDNLTKITQSGNGVTQERLFKYDAKSQLTHERQVEATATLDDLGVKQTSGSWTGFYKYTSDGLLDYGIDSRGVKSDFTYDGLNRVASIVYTGESGYQTPTVTYTYDEAEAGSFNLGRLTKAKTAAVPAHGVPATEQNYDYTKAGQVQKQVQTIGDPLTDGKTYALEYGYNLAGQLVSEKYPSGKVVLATVDNFGVVQTVADAQRTYLNGVTINSKGTVSQIMLGNGTSETYTFNDRLQLESQSLLRGTQVLQKYNYNYGDLNPSGVLKNNGKLEQVESFIGSSKQWTQKYKYDAVGRLKESEDRRGDTNALSFKQVFDYDRFGNLFRKASSNPTTGQENPLPTNWIEDNQIDKSKNQFLPSAGVSYDEAGNVVTDNKWRSVGSSYDANGRTVKATRAGMPDARTVYDGLGNRVATQVDTVWRYMIYDVFGKLTAEYGMQGEGSGGVKYLQQDRQGSIRTVTNASGFAVSRTDYQAFGERIPTGVGLRTPANGYSQDLPSKQSYALTEDDDATGQQHTWFRKLETQAGRWSSPDRYLGSMRGENPQSFNRYAYVGNEPTNYADPSGLLAQVCELRGGEIVCSPTGDGYYGADRGWGVSTITITEYRQYAGWDAEGLQPLYNYMYTMSFSYSASFGGFLGREANVAEAILDCILDVWKRFPMGNATQAQRDAFNLEKKQLLEKFNFKAGQASQKDLFGAGVVFTGVIVGWAFEGVVTGSAGGPVGMAIGLFLGLVAGTAVHLFDEHQRRKEFEFDAKQIAERHPEAAKWYANYEMAGYEIRTKCIK